LQAQLSQCPNCETELAEAALQCPVCHLSLHKVKHSEVLTRFPFTDGLLGVLLGTIGIATGIGAIAVLIAYFRLRNRYPYFCVGLLVSWLSIVWILRFWRLFHG
jgi:hypothetical protein